MNARHPEIEMLLRIVAGITEVEGEDAHTVKLLIRRGWVTGVNADADDNVVPGHWIELSPTPLGKYEAGLVSS
ncbi:hypothetical protein [Pseudomonas petrae]|uniref:Uncharacterized protein n=1 Tax=Pseudomonas petrae TaxID=2912190 RepID=A0ABS9IDY4_9PSED|nr:hypothetical protein [Pseudomonas petrae]MCF7540226.1 hypothetical protein [Pseudomonas petrae]MCF7545696.1 hypothetical protein [Pseudomonas petrae]